MLDTNEVRRDFPILDREFHGRRLVYLDSANTSQKPHQVIDAMGEYYSRHNANVHRAVYALSEESTRMFEESRDTVARFAGADRRATVFTKNITEAINLVAYAWGLRNLREGDEILFTEMEHHANLVSWQVVAKLTGARVRAIPVTDGFRLDLDALDGLLTERTRIVAVSAMSNVLGTVNPVRAVAERAHAVGALVLADAAQAVPHFGVKFDDLGVDFMGFTARPRGPAHLAPLATPVRDRGAARARPDGPGTTRRRGLVHARGGAPPRRRAGARRRGDRGPCRRSLRQAVAPALRSGSFDAGLCVPLQHERRGGRAGHGLGQGAAHVRVARGRDR